MTKISQDFQPVPPQPVDRLMVAISTLQAISLAQTSECCGPSTWGPYFMPAPALDATINILIGMIPEVERLDNRNPRASE